MTRLRSSSDANSRAEAEAAKADTGVREADPENDEPDGGSAPGAQPSNDVPEDGPEPSELVRQLLEQDNFDELAALLEDIHLSEGVRALLQLSDDERTTLLTRIPVDLAADLIDDLPTEYAANLIDALEIPRAVEILEALESDVRADLIGEAENAEEILAAMNPLAAAQVRRMAAYEPDTAGGLMIGESLTISQDLRVADVVTLLASAEADEDRYRGQSPYMIDADGRVVGYASLRTLLSARRSALLRNVMSPAMSVPVTMKLDELSDLFDRYEFMSIPVCDADGHILGIVSQHAVDLAELERSESDSYKRQGVMGDELRSMPLWLRSRRRLSWLSLNIVLNIMAASIISMYESTLAAVIALAVFLPMVSDMSGCSGNQAVAVSLRELALGVLKPIDAFRVWVKEVSVGVINGIVLGILIGLVAWLWKGNAALGLVIGVALALNTVLAVSIGGVIPLLLKRFGKDPAVASGPLLTTITDMAGFFLVLSLASAFMPWLVPA